MIRRIGLLPLRKLEHLPAKACPRRDRGWTPVRRRNCDQSKKFQSTHPHGSLFESSTVRTMMNCFHVFHQHA